MAFPQRDSPLAPTTPAPKPRTTRLGAGGWCAAWTWELRCERGAGACKRRLRFAQLSAKMELIVWPDLVGPWDKRHDRRERASRQHCRVLSAIRGQLGKTLLRAHGPQSREAR